MASDALDARGSRLIYDLERRPQQRVLLAEDWPPAESASHSHVHDRAISSGGAAAANRSKLVQRADEGDNARRCCHSKARATFGATAGLPVQGRSWDSSHRFAWQGRVRWRCCRSRFFLALRRKRGLTQPFFT